MPKGCSPAWQDPLTGSTVAEIICRWAEEDADPRKVANKLLTVAAKAGAPMGLRPSHGNKMSALHWAAKALDAEKCSLLMAAGTLPNELSGEGKTPLHYLAAKFGARNGGQDDEAPGRL